MVDIQAYLRPWSKPISGHPSSYISPQQTTDKGSFGRTGGNAHVAIWGQQVSSHPRSSGVRCGLYSAVY